MSQLKVNAIRHTSASSDAVTLASDGTCTAKITNNLSNRNLIINGAMQVAQRGTSSTTVNTYLIDRFKTQWGGPNNPLTHSQHTLTSSDTGPWEKGFRKSYHLQNGDQSSADAADYVEIYYHVEDQDIANSGWNYTSASSKLVLSYWVKSSVAQKFYGSIYTRQAWTGNGKMYSFEISNGGSNLSANTWTKVTHVIPGDSGLAFDSDNTSGFSIAFIPFYGTDLTNSGNTLNTWGAWSSTNKTPDMTSTWFLEDDATFEITGVQLEVDSTGSGVATDFEHRSFTDELARCQRYFYQLSEPVGSGDATVLGFAAFTWGTTNLHGVLTFPTDMRTAPTLEAANGTGYWKFYSNSGQNSGATFDTFISNGTLTPRSAEIYGSGNLSTTIAWGGFVRKNSASASLAWSAEL